MGDYSIDTLAMKGWRYRLKRIIGTPQPRFMQDTPLELKTNEDIREWFYNGKVSRPINVWNKLLKLSFVKENQLYNKEGQLHEDILWMYYLMRCLNHAAFVHEVTYLHHRRPGSICTGTKYDERLRHIGYIFREIAENIVPGERLEEIMFWHKLFCDSYIDIHGNADYQFSYNAFRREISAARHRSENHQYSVSQLRSALWLLTTVNFFKKNSVGRIFFKTALRVRHLPLRIVHLF